MLADDHMDMEALKALMHKVYSKIDEHSKHLEELQQEQESLAEWIRGIQHILEKTPADAPPKIKGSGAVTCHFRDCKVYITPD